MRLQSATQQLTNHRELPAMRRQIARLKTIERERQLAQAAGGARSAE
jgi:ribosomal protein L29